MTPAIIRQAPGEKTRWPGTYALVGHYGDPKGFVVKLGKGQRLPLTTAADEDGPLWYVLVDISTEDAQAA
jgi:hypothetical protein